MFKILPSQIGSFDACVQKLIIFDKLTRKMAEHVSTNFSSKIIKQRHDNALLFFQQGQTYA